MDLTQVLLFYLAVMSVISAGVTVYDKAAAKKRPERRVPEIALFSLAAVGGAAAMFLVMLVIRHKTKHPRFMLGLPVIIGLQILIGFVLFSNF